MDAFQSYVFQKHSREKIREWANSLLYFRFCRAIGGHANDGDHFLVSIAFADEGGLCNTLKSLGLKPKAAAPRPQQPKRGGTDSQTDLVRMKRPIREFPHLEQIGHCEIDGTKCYVWVENSHLTISVSGDKNPYEVDDDAFQRAVRIDNVLEVLSDQVIDPPQDNRKCICPKYHPELWA